MLNIAFLTVCLRPEADIAALLAGRDGLVQ